MCRGSYPRASTLGAAGDPRSSAANVSICRRFNAVRRPRDSPRPRLGGVRGRQKARNSGKQKEQAGMSDTSQTPSTIDAQTSEALRLSRFFTKPGVHPFETVEWELRDALIGHGGKVSFEQIDVEFPKSWSQNATNIVAQKY